MTISINWAKSEDVEAISTILLEAHNWLCSNGQGIWVTDELQPDKIFPYVEARQFLIAQHFNIPAGVVRFQTEDKIFWPEFDQGDSAFIHRLAVARTFAKSGVSKKLIEFSINHAGTLGKKYLRLDCFANRPKLREIYEQIGFEYHSNIQLWSHEFSRYVYSIT